MDGSTSRNVIMVPMFAMVDVTYPPSLSLRADSFVPEPHPPLCYPPHFRS
ncbi:unnamed protein product [Spirodela intermedia]|uniref:Uncharacterized protein n=1 Tax=Spirodela intermedia TaxID=51605 RepID=A0A7I8IGC2_SPIIN|nr:unnamed protein product [Spirodela intermedia]CAA6656123.1 unnamed protein product [Spirodela intermedia]